LVTDDLLRVERSASGVWCYRGSTELRLRMSAAQLADQVSLSALRILPDERAAATPLLTNHSRLPLAAIVSPRRVSVDAELEVRRLTGVEALLELVRAPRTAGWVSSGPLQRDLKLMGSLAEVLPIYEARVPSGPPFSSDIARRLLAALGI
jgi:hypothetical protein